MSKGSIEKSPASFDGGGEEEEEDFEIDFVVVAARIENLLRFSLSWSFEKDKEVNRDPSDGPGGHVPCFIFFSDESPPSILA